MEWRDIECYEGYYQVSNTGLVRAISRTIIFADGRKRNYPEKMLPIKEWFKNGKGYLMVSLTKHHKTKGFSVHRLVANAFIPNPNNYPQVNHKDEDKSNNQVENLEWCSAKYNNRYSNAVRVTQYDKKWNIIKTWECIADAASTLNIPAPDIVLCCTKKSRSAGGFFWCYEDDKSMSNALVLSDNELDRRRELRRIAYYKDIEKSRARARASYHRTKKLKGRRERHKMSQEEIRAYQAEWRKENREKLNKVHREWYQKNREKILSRRREKREDI